MTPDLRLSRFVVASDALSLSGQDEVRRVVLSTRTGALRVLGESLWRRLRDGALGELPPAIRDELAAAKLLVSTAEDELASVLDENDRAIAADDVLYQVIQPTAWCQLGCGYCGQRHTADRLAAAEQEALLARVRERLASGRYRALRIGWFGAEPLAGLGIMRALGPQLRAAADAAGCTYSARIVTNGLALTADVAAELVDVHAVEEAEITLDGLSADHDRRRPTKRGGPSFAAIFDNLREVAERTSLGLVVRCNVDRENAPQIGALIDALADAGLQRRVRFYTAPVHAWGNDAHTRSLSRQEYAEWELEWLARQHRRGFPVGLVPQRKPIVCMSVRRDAEVLDATGASYNCTEVSYVPTYAPDLYPIRLAGGRSRPDAAGAAALRDFNAQILAGAHPECRACPMLPVCGGQCPKAWHEGHAPCPAAKINMPQRLNLLFAVGLGA